MVVETELERTFLAKFLPENIFHCNFTELKDNYIPKEATHPIIRIRKRGDKMVITKKYRKDEDNASVMIEETIPLTLEEYSFLDKLEGKKFSKHRYVYEYKPGKYCEIDIYQESLKGLVLIDLNLIILKKKKTS
jgi:CYTH domain-containing protein